MHSKGQSIGAMVIMGALLFVSLTAVAQSQYRLKPELKLKENANSIVDLGSANYQVSAGLRGTYFEDEFNRDTLSAFVIKASVEQQLSENIKGNARVQTIFEQGTAQGLEKKSTRRDSGFFLRDAKITYSPYWWLDLQAGAIEQNQASEIVTARQPYPAFKQKVRLASLEKLKLNLTTQQAIPASQKLSSKAVEKEELPGFFTARMNLDYNFSLASELLLSAGYYHFQNLPAAVAASSCELGNSTSTCELNSEFEYGFSGLDTMAELKLQVFNRVNWQSTFEYTQNFEATSGRAQGFQGRTGLVIKVGKFDLLKIRGGYFEKQSDVAPGFYSHWLLEGNRRGVLGWLEWVDTRNNLRFRSQYIDSQPLAKGSSVALQRPVTSVLFSMEKSYANF